MPTSETRRVIVTRPIVGIAHMQVCAVQDATDDEILVVCNLENPAGTSSGWSFVCRTAHEFWGNTAPIPCGDDPDRVHLLVEC